MEILKEETLDNVKYTYATDWINNLEKKEHWLLYREQQSILREFVKKGDNVLEIGPGTGFCCNYLKSLLLILIKTKIQTFMQMW